MLCQPVGMYYAFYCIALHMAHGGKPHFGMFDPQPCAPEFPKHIALSMPCATPPYISVLFRTHPYPPSLCSGVASRHRNSVEVP